MAGVSVTIGSLNNVKRAILDFQTDVESLSDKISSSTERILIEVKQSIKRQESIVTALKDSVITLTNDIEQIQTSIISVNTKVSSLRTEIVILEKQFQQWEKLLSQMEQKKRHLETQKDNSQGDTSRIDTQIRELENQIQNCRRTLSQINAQNSFAKRQQAEVERKGVELKECKVRKEGSLSTTKSELSRSESKLERLSAAGDSVEREIANLNIATRKFEQISISSNTASKAGVNKCIAEIEEYLAINLGTSGHNGTVSEISRQTGGPTAVRKFPYSTSDEMPDNVYRLARGYQENPGWNQTIRDGNSTPEIDEFRSIINQNHLSETAHFTRRATLADMGQELQNLSLDELSGRTYPFIGIMSASNSQSMANSVSPGNVVCKITAPAGTCALDLTNLSDFQEVMFDSPVCHIDSAEMCGYNTICVNLTIQ